MTNTLRLIAGLIVAAALSAVQAAGLAGISAADAAAGVREALTRGATYAVSSLGRDRGFLDNPKVRIELPEPLNSAERVLRAVGMGAQADELVETMNHAAEAAVAQAGPILREAIRKMSVKDAKEILTGDDDSVSQYFRRSSGDALTQKFRPIVRKSTQKLQLTEKYNRIAGKAASVGLIDPTHADLDSYVTQKSLDGLFTVIAEQEKSLRENPLGAGSQLLKKVFGAL